MNIWNQLSEDITPIDKVHVSNKGHFGTVKFDKESLNVDALAYIVEAKKLGFSLKDKIKNTDNIQLICPAQVTDFKLENQQVSMDYSLDGVKYQQICRLMLAADGVQSSIRKKLDLETQIKSYDRTAIICNITPEFKHQYCAYERLTKTGPTAMLPFVQNRCGFVWTVQKDQADELLALNDSEFLRQAQSQFGYRLGKFIKVGRRSSYPLYLVAVPKQVKNRTILLGNAAHSMSPVSAQGLNLAVRDVAMLSDVIEEALDNKIDIGSDEILNIYQNSIELDQSQTIKYTDDLMNWFKIDEPLVSSIRSLGLLALDQSLQAKKALFGRASGYRGHSPKLLRVK
ncbi:MAG: FAD-dependent monooxygenase [Proteobacteria bacterium]|nr:FAD-dependent monooxygenase [Pseudomonadota bacterium]